MGIVVRAAYVILIFLVWSLVLAGIPDAFAQAGDNAELRQMFIERGLPESFEALFRVGLDILSLLVFSGMAVFLLVRRGDDWMALYIGAMLMLTAQIYSYSTYDQGVALWINVLLTALEANFGNVWAAAVREAAAYFDLGLANLFQPPDPKVAVAMSYGTAALIWWAITAVVVRLVRRIG